MRYNPCVLTSGHAILWSSVLSLALLLGAQPAAAIVFIDAAARTAGLGAGEAWLGGEAELIVSGANGVSGGCSGSLVGGGAYVLTAAHCVTDAAGHATAASIALTFANSGLKLTATDYLVDPQWDGSISDGGDLALVKLGKPITSIPSYRVDVANAADKAVVTLAGYGDTGVGASGYANGTFGTLRFGENQYGYNVGFAYLYEFDKNDGSQDAFGDTAVGPDEAMIAPGDSGGASFVFENGVWTIVGVHEFISCIESGCTANSRFGQFGGDVSLYANASWLEAVLAPGAPEPATWLLLATGFLGLAAATCRHARNAPAPG